MTTLGVLARSTAYPPLGYPAGLQGEEVPLSGRILAVVDVFDALTSSRPPRREAVDSNDAIAYLRAPSGTRFDPAAVTVFDSPLAGGSIVVAPSSEGNTVQTVATIRTGPDGRGATRSEASGAVLEDIDVPLAELGRISPAPNRTTSGAGYAAKLRPDA